MSKGFVRRMANRLLAHAARLAPGGMTLRVWLHRLRGVRIGKSVYIGHEVLLETEYPERIEIGDGVVLSIRATIIAHFSGGGRPEDPRGGRGASVRIENDAFIGPGSIVLPYTTIGRGAVVGAGSVVSRAVPPMLMVQGNPARPVARCGVPLGLTTPMAEFTRALRPLRRTSEGTEPREEPVHAGGRHVRPPE